MGTHRHRDFRDGNGGIPGLPPGGIAMPPPMTEAQMMMLNANSKPPAFSLHDRRLRTAQMIHITIPTPNGNVVFPMGGMSIFEQAAINIASGCPEMSPAEVAKRAAEVLVECQKIEPVMGMDGQPVRQVGPLQWEPIPRPQEPQAAEAAA